MILNVQPGYVFTNLSRFIIEQDYKSILLVIGNQEKHVINTTDLYIRFLHTELTVSLYK